MAKSFVAANASAYDLSAASMSPDFASSRASLRSALSCFSSIVGLGFLTGGGSPPHAPNAIDAVNAKLSAASLIRLSVTKPGEICHLTSATSEGEHDGSYDQG